VLSLYILAAHHVDEINLVFPARLMVRYGNIAYDLSRHIVCKTLVNLHGKPCPDPVCTVAEYTARHPVVVPVPSDGVRLVGEKLGRCFSTTSVLGMKLISSLTTALQEFHDSDICLSGFDESNLVVAEDTKELLFIPTILLKLTRLSRHGISALVSI
jgi:hypothetical protein